MTDVSGGSQVSGTPSRPIQREATRGIPVKLWFHDVMNPHRPQRYTAGRVETDLRRIVRAMVAAPERDGSDRELAELRALHDLGQQLDMMIDDRIVQARRRDSAPVSWAAIGEALAISGQAAGKRARARHLPVHRPRQDDYERLVTEGRRLLNRSRRTEPAS